jgi:hypothetical protein
VTLYHVGSMETDVYGNARFYGMKNVTMMFDERPPFAQIFARACEEISCNINDPRISIQGLLSHITSGTVVRRLISIALEDDWVRYVRIVKTIVPPCLDVVVRKLSVSHCDTPVGLSPQMPNASRIEAPLLELQEEVVVVPDAQSVSNEYEISHPLRGVCGASNPVVPPGDPIDPGSNSGLP